ncbi:TRAFAC clade GTPase domain-containing protein [Chryseobacterium limigenitum]|uniref:Double-GTPase 1 domain-containing protein n=1 Tax=Chryseobacterium limigenitum TaxID=1612149 RepID=A0A1K2IKP1_9FLAO|nr:hypothetical protein [Chryseobacterium limigenitum]SFZ92988.1 hypothetical protein SAMN05216324_10476 [Chryseobacterium limigenitum]
MEHQINNNILIIGPPNSGKTTFFAQLYGRIQSDAGVIKLRSTPKNITAIEKAYDRLANGDETESTPATDNREITIPIKWNEKELDLTFKDYGGEQVNEIINQLAYDKVWKNRTKDNDRWILFIRPGEIYHHYDLTVTGYADVDPASESDNWHNDLSHQYIFIELVQALLHARAIGIKTDIESPKLVVALTCWDELNTELTPNNILLQKMPLFLQFISTIWAEESLSIVGLSAQEFSLDNQEAKDKYLDDLPESFGYIVTDSETKERDLTKLIEIALEL